MGPRSQAFDDICESQRSGRLRKRSLKEMDIDDEISKAITKISKLANAHGYTASSLFAVYLSPKDLKNPQARARPTFKCTPGLEYLGNNVLEWGRDATARLKIETALAINQCSIQVELEEMLRKG